MGILYWFHCIYKELACSGRQIGSRVFLERQLIFACLSLFFLLAGFDKPQAFAFERVFFEIPIILQIMA